MIIFINVFHVDPLNQDKVVTILGRVTRDFVRGARGFHSSILHRSQDGTKVTMYAKWTSLADYEAMRLDPRPRETMAELASLARFDGGSYEIAEEFASASS